MAHHRVSTFGVLARLLAVAAAREAAFTPVPGGGSGGSGGGGGGSGGGSSPPAAKSGEAAAPAGGANAAAAGSEGAGAWWLPPANAYAAATGGAVPGWVPPPYTGYPAGGVYPPQQVPAYANSGYGAPYSNPYAQKGGYYYAGYPYYGNYPTHPYAAAVGSPAVGYGNAYSVYPASYNRLKQAGLTEPDQQHESSIPRFAQQHADTVADSSRDDSHISDAHLAAKAHGYEYLSWADFAPQPLQQPQHGQSEGAQAWAPQGYPSAYSAAQRAHVLQQQLASADESSSSDVAAPPAHEQVVAEDVTPGEHKQAVRPVPTPVVHRLHRQGATTGTSSQATLSSGVEEELHKLQQLQGAGIP